MLPQPVVDAFPLAGIYDPLPPDVAGSFVIFCNDIRVACQNRYDRIRPESSAIIGIVDRLTILHNIHCNRNLTNSENKGIWEHWATAGPGNPGANERQSVVRFPA